MYIGSNSKNSVVPVQVKKRTIEETVDGNNVTYYVGTPKRPNDLVDLSKIQGQIFVSLEEAHRTMINNAEHAAKDILDKARIQIEKMVGIAHQASQRFPQSNQQQSFPVEKIQLDNELDNDLVGTSEDTATIYEQDSLLLPQQTPLEIEENVIMVPDPKDPEKTIPVKVGSLSLGRKK